VIFEIPDPDSWKDVPNGLKFRFQIWWPMTTKYCYTIYRRKCQALFPYGGATDLKFLQQPVFLR